MFCLVFAVANVVSGQVTMLGLVWRVAFKK